MNKKDKQIIILVIALAGALIGLVSVQAYLLFTAYQQKEQAFERNVLGALTTVSQKLEVDETAGRVFSVMITSADSSVQRGNQYRLSKDSKIDTTVLIYGKPKAQPMSSERREAVAGPGGKREMRIEVVQTNGIDTLIEIRSSDKRPPKRLSQSFTYDYSVRGNSMTLKHAINDSMWSTFRDTASRGRKELVSKVVDNLSYVERLPIEKRISEEQLDSLLHVSLLEVGIDLPYRYVVLIGGRDSVSMMSTLSADTAVIRSGTKVRLFPNDILSPRYELSVLIPSRTAFVVRELGALVLLTLLFLAVIITVFISTIRTIYRQKESAATMIDFINNMTHEFKTPISTIALASEAIARPESIRSKPKIMQYNSLISHENQRMQHQVEKILQMAVIEESGYELQRNTIDLHQLLREVIANSVIHQEGSKGTITSDFRATRCSVMGDPVHLTNVVHTVLDNAQKYSAGPFAITVTTRDAERGRIELRIADRGIGIRHEDIPRVFEKYFRASTGNIHDVKGFGLGLSYVKRIVELHQGTVRIESAPGNGTTVSITVPAAAV